MSIWKGLTSELFGVLPYAAPIAFAAIGETVGQLSGVINIGIEGMMQAGAYGAYLGAADSHNAFGILSGFAIGGIAGTALAIFSAVFTLYLAIDQVVVGTAINLLALGVTATLFRIRTQNSTNLVSLTSLHHRFGFDIATELLIALVIVLTFALYKTGWGLALRSSGEYPKATESAGFSVLKLRLSALIIGGLMAGLAGAYLVVGTTGSYATNMTTGRGFVAIALVTFGRWKPVWVFASALLIGFLEILNFEFQAIHVHVPHELLLALPYIISLAILVIAGKSAPAPESLGVPFRRQK